MTFSSGVFSREEETLSLDASEEGETATEEIKELLAVEKGLVSLGDEDSRTEEIGTSSLVNSRDETVDDSRDESVDEGVEQPVNISVANENKAILFFVILSCTP